MDLPLHVVSQTASKITLGWTPVPGAIGYRFQSAATTPKWSHTWDGARTTVTFSKAAWYKVQALGLDAEGVYPPVTPPPPSGGPPPPVLSDPVRLTVPSRGGTGDSGEYVISLAAGKDYEIAFQGGIRYGPIWVVGNNARHMVILPGQRQVIEPNPSSAYQAHRGWAIYDVQGTTRFEDYLLGGAGLAEGINYQCHDGTLQVVETRFEDLRTMSNNPAQHPDAIQLWDSNIVHLYDSTVYTNYQGFWWSKAESTAFRYATKIIMDRVNVRCLDNRPIVPFALLSPKTEYRLNDVYVEIPGRGLKDATEIRESDDGGSIHPVNLWAWQEFHADGSPGGPVHGPAPYVGGAMNYSPLSDIQPAQQGDYIVFPAPSTDRIWNLDGSGPGRVYAGVPASGDFAP